MSKLILQISEPLESIGKTYILLCRTSSAEHRTRSIIASVKTQPVQPAQRTHPRPLTQQRFPSKIQSINSPRIPSLNRTSTRLILVQRLVSSHFSLPGLLLTKANRECCSSEATPSLAWRLGTSTEKQPRGKAATQPAAKR